MRDILRVPVTEMREHAQLLVHSRLGDDMFGQNLDALNARLFRFGPGAPEAIHSDST